MKLSSPSLLFAVALLSVNNNNIVVLGQAVDPPCGAEDTLCSGEYTAPDAPSVCKGDVKPTDSCKVACAINGISYVCTNGVFEKGGVGAAFSDPPAGPPTGCDGTPEDCSGTAVITGNAITISKNSEETDVSGIDIGIDDSAASTTASTTASTIVSSIVGITAAVGVVALL
jgi:hypothetical protein